MADIIDQETRGRWMANIRGKDTKPELYVRSYLHRARFRFRLHKKGLPGRPDLWLKKYNAAIFVNGCFWHQHSGCKDATIPDENKNRWQKKFANNVARDQRNLAVLKDLRIRVLVIWECELDTIKGRTRSLPKLSKWLESKSRYREIPPPSHARRVKIS